MNEADRLAATDPQAMLDRLRARGGISRRKGLLFVCAVLRQGLTTDSAAAWQSLELAERWADGEATDEEVERFQQANPAPWAALTPPALDYLNPSIPFFPPAMRAAMPGLLLDIFGNPFRPPPPVAPPLLAQNDATVQRLARVAYDERLLPSGHLDPGRLAVLCDALLDAGVPADAKILLHLRGDGPHLRGCWAVDAVLGKS
jgi:hypothetical protein